MSFVLDASVALAWCFEDEGGKYAEAVLRALDRDEAFVPSLWTLELTNGLLAAERRGRIEASEVMRVQRLIRALPIALDPPARSRVASTVYRLARTHHLTAYDAAYLELATRLALPLATLDEELRAAADREGVERFGPGRGE